MTAPEDEVRTSRHLLVSGRIRLRRQTLGLTQKQVASRLGRLGVSGTNKMLSSLEHGAGVDAARLPELAEALECTVTWLLGLTDDPHRWEPERPARRPGTRPALAPASAVSRGAETLTPARGSRSRPVADDAPSGHRSWIIGPVAGSGRP